MGHVESFALSQSCQGAPNMKVMLFVALAATVAFCNALAVVDDAEWEQYKAEFGKSYESDAVERIRRQIYWSKQDFVQKHNDRYARNETSYYVGINQFSDMLDVEVVQLMNGYKHGLSHKMSGGEIFDVSGKQLPDKVDWRTKGVVTPIKNQQSCGGCWAFSATGSLEGQHALKTNKLVSLSEQNLIDCSDAEGNEGCNGGLMNQGFFYVKVNNGIDTENSYPFIGINGLCLFKRSDVGATLTSWGNVFSGSEEALKEAVATIGPVSVAIDASLNSFQNYAGGVYDEPACSSTSLDHGVLVVGYGTYEGKDYWLVKNSWGTTWGLNGYIMMSRNKNNQCGIATEPSYPIV